MSCISRSCALFQIRSIASSSALPLSKLRPSSVAVYKTPVNTTFRFSPSTSQSATTTRGFRSTAAKMSDQTVHEIKSADEFKKVIQGQKVVLVDFWATWCGPCRVISPVVAQLARTYPNIHYIKVDVDELSSVAQEYGIRAMPTFLVFKDGQKVDELVGANAHKLEGLIQSNHPSS